MTGRFVRATARHRRGLSGADRPHGLPDVADADGLHSGSGHRLPGRHRLLPPGSSLQRTDAVVREVNDIILKVPGTEHTSPVTGFDVTTSTIAPNVGTIFYSSALALRKAHSGRQCRDDVAESARGAGRHQGCRRHRGQPARRPGSGCGRRLQADGRGSRRSHAAGTRRRDQRAGCRGQQGSGLWRCLHPLQRRRAFALRRHRPREGREGRSHPDRRVLDPAAVSRFGST